jgi:mRNA-degrading endonuclease toxin of MazEF toxin-antitoxin module
VPPDGPPAARFGEVWATRTAGQEAPRLIVSGRRYASGRPDMVLTAIIDAPPGHPSCAAPASGFLGEEIRGIGRAQLDLITVVYRDRLTRKLGELPADRHASVADRIRDLIGS